MNVLSPEHFLSLPRPDVILGPPTGVPDTTTLAAHDFDVDTRTGFMPPEEPLARLPILWEAWEATLDQAVQNKLQLGEKFCLSEEDSAQSESWRALVRELPVIPIDGLERSEVVLRRAHHVLAWVMHFYIHSLPSDADVRIPASITIPLLQICTQIQLPPVLTFSDDVLYNWTLKRPDSIPTVDNLQCKTLFTSTSDEEEFYLCSARIELKGVESLELMRATMDEMFVGDEIAVRRITAYLYQMSTAIGELTRTLLAVREGCDPDVFNRDIRPWFRGADSDPQGRKWVFEGLEEHPELQEPTELSGASAGQSSLIHALDTFLGVHTYSHSSTTSDGQTKPSFLSRMQLYMPRHHRGFLNHLAANPRPLRSFVTSSEDAKLLDSYNAAVLSLKGFRDAHMKIVSLYILGPARRLRAKGEAPESMNENEHLKGTGGTDMVKLLKEIRDQTAGATMTSV